MKIAIGSDHVGYEMKEHIKAYLSQKGFDILDMGTHDNQRAEYPKYAQLVAHAVVKGECGNGILICGTGVGVSITANKIPGIRAAVCSEPYSARLSKEHNNANIIAFGARVIGPAMAEMIVDAFLEAVFEGGRHQYRVDMINELDKGR